MVGIGIDLGTTNCCVAVVRHGKVEVLENHAGNRTTPSVLSFAKNELIIGSTAKKQAIREPENTIYDVKRLIGLKYTDPEVQKQVALLPFKIINSDNKLKIDVQHENGRKFYVPEQLSGFILKQLKVDAEARLDTEIDNVVITVPSYFTDSQRQATVDAGKIAGFKKVNLLNEPTAAAIHYGIDNEIGDGRIILVFDFGGGTFDVSIIKYSNNVFEVLAIDGDANLGGEDVDNQLLQFFKAKLKLVENNKGFKRAMARLKEICESAKIDLSTKHEVYVELLSPDDEYTLTRTQFDDLTNDIINKTMEIIKKCLANEDIPKIDDILLVGGSTRIKKVRDELKRIFDFIPKQNTNADEAVASGAAIYAAKIYDNQFPQLKTINVCQHSLGVEIAGERMSTLIKKFTKLPAKKTKKYRTENEEHNRIDVKIFCGEDISTKNNLYLGELIVTGIASGPKGTILHETFEVDENGILNVTAADESGVSTKMSVDLNKGSLTSTEIDFYSTQLLEVFKRSEQIKKFQELKNELENFNGCDLDWLRNLEYSEQNYNQLFEKRQQLTTNN